MMLDIWNEIQAQVSGYVPRLLAAIGILVVGWLVSLAIASVVRGVAGRVARGRPFSLETAEASNNAATWSGRIVFYVLMVFVIAGAFQALQVAAVAGPLDMMLGQLTAYVPQLIGAGLLLLLAWGMGWVLRLAVRGALRRSTLGKRLAEGAGLKAEQPVAESVGDVVFWLPMLLFLPAVLSALELEGLVAPLQGMFDDLLRILPDVLGAGLILLVGWFIARIVRQILTGVLGASGLDRLGARIGMGADAEERRLSSVVGLVAYALILIPTTIAALDALRIEAISGPATMMLSQVLSAIPLLFAAAMILAVAYLVGRVIAGLVGKLLEGVGFDRLFERLGLKIENDQVRKTPSEVAGFLILVAAMSIAVVEAAGVLGFSAVASLTTELMTFGTRLFLGLVIFGVGLYLSGLVARSMPTTDGRWSSVYAAAARVSILTLATTMALQQTGVAPEIVTLAFGALIGAVALAGAIAFGFGARDAAGRLVNDWTKEKTSD